MASSPETSLAQLLPQIRQCLESGQKVSFYPKGTSMLPMVRQGIDRVVLSPVPGTLKKYDLPLYRRDSGQFVMHRIVKTGDTYTCVGDNQYKLEPGIRHDQMIALVTGFFRADRYIPVTALRYRLYCRFWCGTRGLRRFRLEVKQWLRRHLT